MEVKSKKPLIYFTSSILIIGFCIFIWWVFWARFEVSTEDAYVHGNQVRLTPQISGYVSAVYCEETDYVKEGQILVTLDQTDNKIAFEKAKASLGNIVREVTTLFENVYSLAAIVKEKEAELIRAEIDFLDREAVLSSGAISEEDYIHAKTNFLAVQNGLQAAYFNLRKAISLVENTTVETHPKVSSAIEHLKLTYVNLKRCEIKAPASGIVAQRTVQVGESISPSSLLLAIVPLDQMWVDANFKETHMSKIRLGQTIKMTSDFYGRDIEYLGRVIGIAGGTGAIFSPLPPQNATGNWIKIVQRVPVRISIDERLLQKYPLRLGLSMNVCIDIKDTEGLKVPKPIEDKNPLWSTNIFVDQEEGIKEIIQDIFLKNKSFNAMITEEVRLLGSKHNTR
jgi:membrane fusion protein (multidrug efflux system)